MSFGSVSFSFVDLRPKKNIYAKFQRPRAHLTENV